MKIEVGADIKVTNPSEEFLKWLPTAMVIPNPEYNRRAMLGLYKGNVPQRIYIYIKNGDTYELPYGALRHILSMQNTEGLEVVSKFEKPVAVDFQGTVPLYDYQEDAVQAMEKGYYGVLQSPAGSGKTQMGLALAARLGRKTLWLTHTKDLVKQAYGRAACYFPKELMAITMDGKVEIGKAITFATVQTFGKMDLRPFVNTFDTIIIDEVHHCVAGDKGLNWFARVVNALAARHKYGLSATLHRADGTIAACFAMVGDIIYNVPERVTEGKIIKPGLCPVPSDIQFDMDAICKPDGQIIHGNFVDYICESEFRNRRIISLLKFEKDKSCLILSDRKSHLRNLIAMLPEYLQKQSVVIYSETNPKVREKALDDMRKGKKKFLFATYALAKEGLDIPILSRLFMTVPHRDYAVVVQCLGRISRTCEGKPDPVAYDFVDNELTYALNSFRARNCTVYRKMKLKILDLPEGVRWE